MIKIVNWILTRRCNFKCEYCGIVKSPKNEQYLPIKHYITNEMSLDYIKMGLLKFKIHNPNCFHIFYGGEPFLRMDLADIINFANENDIQYTIITNNTHDIQKYIHSVLDNVDMIKGFTTSIDPTQPPYEYKNRSQKTNQAWVNLMNLKNHPKIHDVVAEVTVMSGEEEKIYPLIVDLSRNGICSDLTFVDIAKNFDYDFSSVYNEKNLVKPSLKLGAELHKIMQDEKCNVHMKNDLLPRIFDILPSNLNCQLEQEIHNISIDADGAVRLCLRIRGRQTPLVGNLITMFEHDMKVSSRLYHYMSQDKRSSCHLCNHTCQLMSMINKPDILIHLNEREGKKDG